MNDSLERKGGRQAFEHDPSTPSWAPGKTMSELAEEWVAYDQAKRTIATVAPTHPSLGTKPAHQVTVNLKSAGELAELLDLLVIEGYIESTVVS